MVAADIFRKALGNFATGVVVVTSKLPDSRAVGVTISAFSSLSLSPPQIDFCLKKQSTIMSAFVPGSFFAVNMLAENQQDLSNRFSQKNIDPWEGLPMETSRNGVPLLQGCLAYLECQTHDLFEGGDHIIITGDVKNVLMGDEGLLPLLYFRGAYAGIRP